MNEMSMHTMNIASNPNGFVTLFAQLGGGPQKEDSAAGGGGGGSNKGQDVSRCSITGTVVKIPADAEDMAAIRMKYSITHAYADQVMDSPKFAFYRIVPSRVYLSVDLVFWPNGSQWKNTWTLDRIYWPKNLCRLCRN